MTQLLTRPETVILAPQEPPAPPNPRDPTKGAWFGDAGLKAEVLARMVDHRAKDDLLQGLYIGWFNSLVADDDDRKILDSALWPTGVKNTFKGCAVGCTLVDILTKEEIKELHGTGGWHERMAQEYNLPTLVCHMIDNTFESQRTHEEAGNFAVAVISAIPVGADLRNVIPLCPASEFRTQAEVNRHYEQPEGHCEGCTFEAAAGLDLAQLFLDRLVNAPVLR